MPRQSRAKRTAKARPSASDLTAHRRICFVTGTRAEFGLMRPALNAIRSHPRLTLQLIATGMHLDPTRGASITDIADAGFSLDATVPWTQSPSLTPTLTAIHTGQAVSTLAQTFDRLSPDIILIVGDRVEALAAAVAAHLSHRCLAHVHGGDRALGQIDDSLRHAITKLAHLHFPATPQSAKRLLRLGEDPWRIHRIGSPGLDDIAAAAERAAPFLDLTPGRFALLVLHPIDPDDDVEYERAKLVLNLVRRLPFGRIVVIYPNNDPGSRGIMRCWTDHQNEHRLTFHRNLPRPRFLALLRDAAVLVGNSSSGIIEAASFATPVLDIGPRQLGRERSRNVFHCDYDASAIIRTLTKIWNNGRPKRIRCPNVYGSGVASPQMADILARFPIDQNTLGKLIRY